MKDQIAHNRQETLRQIEQVRNYTHLSGEGKRQELKEVYRRGLEKHKQLVQQHEDQKHTELERKHHELFSPAFRISEADYQRDAIRRDYRQALAEADKVLDEGGVKELQRYLERAQLSGDRHAAKAAFSVAHSRSYEPVVEAYLDAFPEEREKYETYQTLDGEVRNPDARQRFADSFELGFVPKPQEIQNYSTEPNAMAQIFGGR
jgi:hypothetical protein